MAEGALINVVQRDGEAHVRAADLERGGIAIKRLSGQKELVACSGDRCGLIKEFIRDGSDLLVRVEAVSKALDAKANFDADRRRVRFDFALSSTTDGDSTAGVGQLAPDFRLRKLDGSRVALSDFRGKRVLINSWASW